MVRNDICSYLTLNEQNNSNSNQYVTNNNKYVEGDQGDVTDEIPDHSDLEAERERKRELSPIRD